MTLSSLDKHDSLIIQNSTQDCIAEKAEDKNKQMLHRRDNNLME